MNLFHTKKTFTGKYLRNLTLYVFAAIIGGVLMGYYFPAISIKLGVVSQYFFMVLETLILPIIFMAIIYGICHLAEIKNADRLIWQTGLYFILTTSLAIILGFIFGFAVQPGANTGIDSSKINTFLQIGRAHV